MISIFQSLEIDCVLILKYCLNSTLSVQFGYQRAEGEESTQFSRMLKARNYLVVNNQCETSSLTPLPNAM